MHMACKKKYLKYSKLYGIWDKINLSFIYLVMFAKI